MVADTGLPGVDPTALSHAAEQLAAQRDQIVAAWQKALQSASIFIADFSVRERLPDFLAHQVVGLLLGMRADISSEEITGRGEEFARGGLTHPQCLSVSYQALLATGSKLLSSAPEQSAAFAQYLGWYWALFSQGYVRARGDLILEHQESMRRSLEESLRAGRETLERRAVQLQTAAEVSRAASSLLDLDELLRTSVDLIRERFDLYYAGIFLVDEAEKYAVLRAGTGEAGRKMLEAGHKLEVGGISMIGWCVANRQPRIALDVGIEAVRFDNPLLPETRSEMALPLVSRGEVIGAMTIQSTKEAAFSDEDIAALQTMADQLANAIQNARLFEETQVALQEVQAVHQHYLREQWRDYLAARLARERPCYLYDGTGVTSPAPMRPPGVELAVQRRSTITLPGTIAGREGSAAVDTQAALVTPLSLRGQIIGVLGFEETEEQREWTEEEVALIEAVAAQLALAIENTRLFEQTQVALEETAALYRASRAIGAATSAAEVGQALMDYAATSGVDAARVLLFEHDEQGQPAYLVMREGWTVDNRPVQPYGTRLSLADYPLTPLLDPNEPVIAEDVLTDPRANEMTRTLIVTISGLRSFALVPITVGERWIGMVFIGRNEPSTFSEALIRGHWTLAGQAAIAMENLRLFEEAQRRARRERLAREIVGKIQAAADVEAVLRTAVRELGRALGTPRSFVQLGTVQSPNPSTKLRASPKAQSPKKEGN